VKAIKYEFNNYYTTEAVGKFNKHTEAMTQKRKAYIIRNQDFKGS